MVFRISTAINLKPRKIIIYFFISQMASFFSFFFLYFYDYFGECEIGVSERARIHSLGRSLSRSLGDKLLFVFPLPNAHLDLTKRKMSSNGSANVKHSEAMSDEIITAMSAACGASIFLFELF